MPGGEAYKHAPIKFVDGGLQLRVPVDLVPPSQYSRLTNVIPVTEGTLRTRPGLASIASVSSDPIHSIFRLNQEVPSIVGDRIVGAGTSIFTAPLPSGSSFTEQTAFSFSGDPLSIVSFRFNLDQASWAIIADKNGMRKYRGGSGMGYYQKLGISAPTAGATASDAAVAGNLDSTGGTGYDWRYTYFNNITGTESNPSPLSKATDVQRATSSTNPDTGFGGSAFTDPANAYDADTSTYATASTTSASETRRSCQWHTWGASSGAVAEGELYLIVDGSVTVAGTNGTVTAVLYYTLDNGTTWKTMMTTNVSKSRQLFSAVIPNGTAFAGLRVRATVFAVGNTSEGTNTIYRRIINKGGEFDVADLLTGGGGTRTIEMRVYDIYTSAILASTSTTLLTLSASQATVCVKAPSDTQVTHIRLYRRGGSLTATWKRMGTFAISELTAGACGAGYYSITDNISDTGLGDGIELDNDVPVYSVEVQERPLPYIWGPFDERLLGVGDPDRPESVYFCKRGNADAWPSANHVEVSSPGEPMVNGCVYNTRTFAFSRERMFELVPNLISGVTFTPFPTPCSRGLWAPRGLVVADAVYFVSKDGIYRTTGGQEDSIVEDSIQPLFPTRDAAAQSINGYESVDMEREEDIRLEHHNGELWFTYRGASTGNRYQLIYDMRKRRWRAADYTPDANVVYSEPSTESTLLVGGATGSLYSTTTGVDAGSNISVTIRTGSYDMGMPLNKKEFGNVLFDIDPGGATVANPVTITPYINGEASAQAALTVTGSGRTQVPLSLSDVSAFNLEFEITWTRTAGINPVLYQFDILWRSDQASVKHWRSDETSHGMPGWHHVRDLYVGIASNGSVTLTVAFDGTSQSYTLATTGGAIRKVYVPLKVNKGKVYTYTLESDNEFQVYPDLLEARAKPWLSNLGYEVTQPFGQEE